MSRRLKPLWRGGFRRHSPGRTGGCPATTVPATIGAGGCPGDLSRSGGTGAGGPGGAAEETGEELLEQEDVQET